MRKVNRIIAGILCFMLVLPFLPVQGFADEAQSGNGGSNAAKASTADTSGEEAQPESDSLLLPESEGSNEAIGQSPGQSPEEGCVPDFIYIDQKEIGLGDTQNIAVVFPEDTSIADLAILTITNQTTGQDLHLNSALIAGNAILFTCQFNDFSDLAEYRLSELRYSTHQDGEDDYLIDLKKDDQHLSFTVISPSKTRLSYDILGEEVTFDVYALDEDGRLAVADDIEEALSEKGDAAAPQIGGTPGVGVPMVPLAGGIQSTASGNLVVALDPGHGGTDGGATGYGLVEKNLTLKIAQYCREELLLYNGVSVFMTRTSDEYVGLTERVDRAEAAGASVFVSIHINAAGGTGAEIFIPNASSYNYGTHVAGNEVAQKILNELVSLGLYNRGIKVRDSEYWNGSGPFYYPDGQLADFYTVISESRERNIPGIIVEHAFIDNPIDAAFLSNESNLRALGLADATGIAKKYGLVPLAQGPSVSAMLSPNQTTATITLPGSSAPSNTSSVSVPTWGDVNGQNDIIWYSATKQSNGNWTVSIPIKNHAEAGAYSAHVYATTSNGAQVWVGAAYFSISAYTPTVAIENSSGDAFDVVVRAITPSGLQSVSVPVWCASDQSDIVWYGAARQADGSFKVRVSAANHRFHEGTYSVHVYATSGNGITGFCATATQVSLPGIALVATPSSDQRNVNIKASGGTLASASSVSIPVWSDQGGQDDIVWYSAIRQSDGSWAVSVPIASHRTPGTYTAHMYATVQGQTVFRAAYFSISAPTAQVIIEAANEELGTFNVVVKNWVSPSGVSQVQIPVWSSSNQSDIVWYTASRRTDGSWAATVHAVNHTYNTAAPRMYIAHAYLTAGNGILALVGSTSVSFQYKGSASYSIMGTSNCSVAQMVALYKLQQKPYPIWAYAQYGAPDIETFCQILYEEANYEGVRAEAVFAQAMQETGWLQFGGDVQVTQCNFAGLGASGNGNPGLSFNDWGTNSVRKGLRAQVQHLKAYASMAPLNGSLVDPRFSYVTRGIAPNVEDLSGKWAADTSYGAKLMVLINKLIA